MASGKEVVLIQQAQRLLRDYAFMPGIGIGLALSAVVGWTPQLLSSCVEAIDGAHGRPRAPPVDSIPQQHVA
jgi:hypothetical protein